MTTAWPQLAVWQFYACLSRIFTGLHMIGHWGWEIHHWTPPSKFEGEAKDYYISRRSLFEGWLAFGIILVFHDLFMVTIDVKRTRTYLGCIAAQMVANLIFTGLLDLHLVLYEKQGSLFSRYLVDPSLRRHSPQYIPFAISALLAGVCSLFLLLVNIPPIMALPPAGTMRHLWKVNAKDAFVGDVPPMTKVHTLSVFGHPRKTKITSNLHRWFSLPGRAVCRIVKRQLTLLFFRRIRPAETLTYAFARNLFAVIAIGVLIFRTVTALQQAQNETSTRVTSETCDNASPIHHLSILSDSLVYDSRWSTSVPRGVNVMINAVWSDPLRSYEAYNSTDCVTVWTQAFRMNLVSGHQRRVLNLFNCSWLPDPIYKNSEPIYTQGPLSDSFAYRVEVRPFALAGGTTGNVYNSQMPHVWFLNRNELPDLPDGNLTWSDVSEVRAYLPPLKLLQGSQINAEANLVTRKFIRSSIVKDMVFNSKPDYRRLSLYPIVKQSVTGINSSDTNVATAVIRPALTPELMYHRNHPDLQNTSVSPSDICDFVEEYRTSTVLDIIGSVGGLFALLQSAHLLLFGRPLFWGLTGAKVITPFGLLGGCGSRSFRRRLREEYHGESLEDGADTIRIVKFLRDFVIDFGPADLDPVKPPERDSTRSPLAPTEGNENPDGAQIPLMNMGSDIIPPPRENDAHGGVNREEDRDCTHGIV